VLRGARCPFEAGGAIVILEASVIAYLGSEAPRLATGRRPDHRSGWIYVIFVLWLFDRLPIPYNPLIL